MSKIRLTSSGLVDIDFTGIRLTSGGLIQGSPTITEESTDVFFQNTLHKIESGMVAQTASSLNGVLIT